MGCRPSKQATSKVRAVDESLCLCSPRKIRKNHKCSGSSSKPVSMGSKKHSLSSGHKPRTANGASMDFPAFSTTTAVYRKSASKTSKITLRLSCDGSTLEIEQCDYDLEKTYGDLSPRPRPWHSAPNLTKLKDKKTRLFRENPMKHSTSAWSPSVSSTVSGCHGLTVRVPVIISATEQQSSNKSLTTSHRSFSDSQAGSGSSHGRCNTGKTPLLKTACRQNSEAAHLSYRNFSDHGSSVDGSQQGARLSYSDQDYVHQRGSNSRADNSTNTSEASVYLHDNKKAINNKTRTHGYKIRDDSESSADLEHIPVNVITSYGPPLPLGKSYRLTDSNHNQFRTNAWCLEDKKTKQEATFVAPHFLSFACERTQSPQQDSHECAEISNIFKRNDFSSHEGVYTLRDNSPINCSSPIDSSSILTFVALGCPVTNEVSNFAYSSDDEAARGLFTPQPGIIDPYDSLDDDVISIGGSNFKHGINSRDGFLYTSIDVGERWGSRNTKEKSNLSSGTIKTSLNHASSVCNGYTNNTKLTSQGSNVQIKEPKREWIDGELRLVKDDETDIEDISTWTSECWSNVKFPVMKTHISASSVLWDSAEHKSCDQASQNNTELTTFQRYSTDYEPSHLRQSSESPALVINHSMDAGSVDGEMVNVDSHGVVSVNSESVGVRSLSVEAVDLKKMEVESKELVNVRSANESLNDKWVEVESETIQSVSFRSDNRYSLVNVDSVDVNSADLESIIVESLKLKSRGVKMNGNDEMYYNTTRLLSKSQSDVCVVKTGEIVESKNLQCQNDKVISSKFQSNICFESPSTKSIDTSSNQDVIQDFQGKVGIDTLKNTLDSHKADYLMELLTTDPNNKMMLDNKETILSCDFENFPENGIYSMSNSSESESSLMWYNCMDYSLPTCADEKQNGHIAHTPFTATNLNCVKINILNTNLNSLDPLNDIILNKHAVRSPIEAKSVTPILPDWLHKNGSHENVLFSHCANLVLKDSTQNNCVESRRRAEKERDYKYNKCMDALSMYITLNGTYTDVHSFENCKYLKLARERQMSAVNDYLTGTTTTEALQSGGHTQTSGVSSFDQDTTGSNISTRLCPPAPSHTQTKSDFEGASVSIKTRSGHPPGTYFERHLNEGSIDPSDITHLDLEVKSPAPFPFHWNMPQCSQISQHSSNRLAKTFLCKNVPRENESFGFNGGHDIRNMDTETIYIKTDHFSKAGDWQMYLEGEGDSKYSTSKLCQQVVSQSPTVQSKGLVGQSVDLRLQNVQQVTTQKKIHFNSNDHHDNCSTGCLRESAKHNTNGNYNKQLDHSSTDHYNETVDLNNMNRNSLSSEVNETITGKLSSCFSQLARNENKKVSLNYESLLPTSAPMCSSHLPDTHNINTIQKKVERGSLCREQSYIHETKQHSHVYLSESKYVENKPRHTHIEDGFDIDTFKRSLDGIKHDRYQPIRDKLKISAGAITPTSYTLDPELLTSPTEGHSVEITSDKRQAYADILFEESSNYRHFAETNGSQTIPRNNVLSLVRYFEKVPFIGNNAK